MTEAPTQDEQLLNTFLTEARENLANIEEDLLTLEASGAITDDELINRIFRAAHSVKGGAGFFNLVKMQHLAHAAENILELLRSHKLKLNTEIVNTLLASFDSLKRMINSTEHADDAGPELVKKLDQLASQKPVAESKNTEQEHTVEIDLIKDVHAKNKTPGEQLLLLQMNGTVTDCKINTDAAGTLNDDMPKELPLTVKLTTQQTAKNLANVLDISPEQIDPQPAPAQTTQTAQTAQPQQTKTATTDAASATLRVSVQVLESLMNLAGELVLARNQLVNAISQSDPRLIATSGQRINLVSTELQEAIMLTRMQPIGNVIGKFPRIVRDLSLELGKNINIEITGKDVAMDKTIIEGLSDPLTHMIRNAVDHGIESPEQRKKAGKSPVGNIALNAFHEAGQVVIEIADDGKGIDGTKIANSAVKKDNVEKAASPS